MAHELDTAASAALRQVALTGLVVFEEEGVVGMALEGSPFVAEGVTLEDAAGELALALREFADDWVDHLYLAPNHFRHAGLVAYVAPLSPGQVALDLVERLRRGV